MWVRGGGSGRGKRERNRKLWNVMGWGEGVEGENEEDGR